MKQMNPAAGRALVDAFECRTGRVMEFCETQGVSYAVLKYWRNRIAELDTLNAEPSTAPSERSFVQVTVPSATMQHAHAVVDTAAVVVILPNHVRFVFQHSRDVHSDIIEALAQC